LSLNYDNDQFVQTVTYAGQPPTSAAAIMADGTWADIYLRYLDDSTGLSGDATYTNAAQFLRDIGNSAPWSHLVELYCTIGSPACLPWPTGAVEIMTDVQNGLYDEAQARQDLAEYCWSWAEQAVPGFLQWVTSVQSAAPSEPVMQQMTVDMIDRAVVDGINQAVLKAAQTPGETLTYWQAGDVVLIGVDHAASYYDALQGDPGYCGGTITIKSRGSTFSAGEITASGSADQAGFKSAIKRFSSKKVTFV
jgi:hypothetical protein